MALREGEGPSCRSQYWTRNIGDGVRSLVGTARTTVIALHYVPENWCCATAYLASQKLIYYDPYYPDPDLRALGALGGYVDQVALEQGAHMEIGAAKFERKLYSTPKNPITLAAAYALSSRSSALLKGTSTRLGTNAQMWPNLRATEPDVHAR